MTPAPPKAPCVSVVIPVFNGEACLEAAVRSVLAQTLVDLEVVIVDDASTDASFAIATRLAEEDVRVRPVRLPRNGGPSAARNRGFALGAGEWIAILDADDRFEPTRLAHLTRFAGEQGCDMVADDLAIFDLGCNAVVATAYPEMQEPVTLSLEDLLRHDLSADRTPYGWLKPVWSRAFLARHALVYAEDQRYAEDFDLLFRCLVEGARFQIVPEAGYVYTPRRGPVSGQTSHLSQTRQDFRAALRANEVLLQTHGGRLSPGERALLQQRIAFFETRAAYGEFLDLMRRRSPRALSHAARHPSVVAGALSAIRRRLTR
ncbi:glycosyltransferase family 2 protein [Aureimonas sp. AU40]|uniref:glycosyltransferase family 2 protein n=1 Tax=Aureimonas sp. AU40 TaxID=1637747 RepID=UPI000785F0A3|nr:glycosyltransferase family 2 protein [Aureimonas sp. AU40]